jgi:hypothetical protein
LSADKFIELPCVACGQPVQVRLDGRYKPPRLVASIDNRLCKREECIRDREARQAEARRLNKLEKLPRIVSEDAERADGIESEELQDTNDISQESRAEARADEAKAIDPDYEGVPSNRVEKLNKPQEGKQPRYLLTPSFPVIYNPANEKAPYGYDENDRPIRPLPDRTTATNPIIARKPRSSASEVCDHGYMADLCATCAMRKKEYSRPNDESERPVEPRPLTPEQLAEQEREFELRKKSLERPKIIPLDIGPEPPPTAPRALHERYAQALREQQRDLRERAKKANPEDWPTRKFVKLREELHLKRSDIIRLLDTVLVKKYTPPTRETIAQDSTPEPIGQGYADYIAACRERMRTLEQEIETVTKKNWPNATDKWLRAERRKIQSQIRCNQNGIRETENEMRRKPKPQPDTQPEALAEKMDPNNCVLGAYVGAVILQRNFVFGDVLFWPLIQLEAIKKDHSKLSDKEENEIIKWGLFCGFIIPLPSPEVYEKCPWLRYPVKSRWSSDTERDPDETENKLAIKTGGASYGGGITSAGWIFSQHTGLLKRRPLTSFDNQPRSHGEGAPNTEPANWGEIDSGDYEGGED